MTDLEGKLRELRNTMVDWTHCTPPFATNVVTEAAALGRAEGLEQAVRGITEVIKSNTGPTGGWLESPRGVLSEAIRALKEKV